MFLKRIDSAKILLIFSYGDILSTKLYFITVEERLLSMLLTNFRNMENPLLNYSGIPLFSNINLDHFEEACTKNIQQISSLFEMVISDTTPATFTNSIVPLDEIFLLFSNIGHLMAFFSSHNRIDNLGKSMAKIESIGSDLIFKIFHNNKLSNRISQVYLSCNMENLDKEDLNFLQKYYYLFQERGAFLGVEEQKRFKEIEEELVEQCNLFNEYLRGARLQQSVNIKDKSALKGLPKKIVDQLAHQAKIHNVDGWLFVPERKLVETLLQCAEHRDFRKKIFKALNNLGTKAPFNTTDILLKINKLKYEKIKLINSGYKNFAQYRAMKSMAKNLRNVSVTLSRYSEKVVEEFDLEVSILQEWVDSIHGPTMEPWDISYYIERYKNEKIRFDTSLFSEYFKLENVINVWIAHIEKLMNVQFKEIKNKHIYSWQPTIIVYQITDLDTQVKSFILLDLFMREQKRAFGIWSSCLQRASQNNGNVDVQLIGMNIVQEEEARDTLLTPDQISNFYHEGGHILYNLKSSNARYTSLASQYDPAEFVEIHSQLQENYPFHPDVLKLYSNHHNAQKEIPATLISKHQECHKFLSSLRSMMILQSSLYDLEFHRSTPDTLQDLELIYKSCRIKSANSHLVNPIRLTRFHFIFRHSNSRYDGKFWSYIWSDFCQKRIFEDAKKHGIYDERVMERIRHFYTCGVRFDPADIYDDIAKSSEKH